MTSTTETRRLGAASKTIKLIAAVALLAIIPADAKSPKLKITLVHGTEIEKQELATIEKLQAKYDLEKYTITKEINIEQGAIAHSSPVLTLNGRFRNDEDLALSQYVHEQGHWLLMTHHALEMPKLYRELETFFPNIPTEYPDGGHGRRDSYMHLPVLILEWQALEDTIGPERARKVLEWKQGDHYKGLYKAVLDYREKMENIMKRYDIKW